MPRSTILENYNTNQNDTSASPMESPNGGTGLKGMLKPPRARLTEQEKKNNHIASEQKRRNAIRDGFDKLAELIPGCEGQGRSEGVMLNRSIGYINDQLVERRALIAKIEALGGTVPPELKNPRSRRPVPKAGIVSPDVKDIDTGTTGE
ncbi:hypothetical protein EV426DRAFT_666001 [Tirmania nivea]|nr:hypothetical protein EV426DRAFT_666001 [Tirmania nivea]